MAEAKENTKLNLYEKIMLIREEAGIIEKNITVGTGTNQYKAVGERDVIDTIKPLEKKYRVFSYPANREIVESGTLTKITEYKGESKESKSQFMRIKTTYKFIDIDNPEDTIEVITYGDGIDTGDKAPGKAMTYADKYALMNAYKLSTGEDPDKEASPSRGYTTETKKATTGQIKLLESVYTGENLTKLLTSCGIKALKEMPMTKASEIIQKIKDKQKEGTQE